MYCMHKVTTPPFMVVLMAAAHCLDKDLHTNGYQKKAWMIFNNYFNVNANVTIHVEIM